MAEKHLVQLRTERFRSSLDPLWVRLRHLLIEKGLDPLSMILASFEEEDFKFRFGIFVGGDGHVYQFGFDFSGRRSSDGRFAEWEDITESWETSPFRESVATGLETLELERLRFRS